MATLRCPHPDHHGQPVQIHQSNSGIWICFMEHRFRFCRNRTHFYLQDLADSLHYPAESFSFEELQHYKERVFGVEELEISSGDVPRGQEQEASAPRQSFDPLDLGLEDGGDSRPFMEPSAKVVSMHAHPARRIEGYRAEVAPNADFKALRIEDHGRAIASIGALEEVEEILISGYLSKEQTMQVLRDLSMGGLVKIERLAMAKHAGPEAEASAPEQKAGGKRPMFRMVMRAVASKK